MSDVLTLTMNPALDVSTTVDRLEEEKKLRCGPAQRDPGGGGLNVARVVTNLGARALALHATGGSVGLELRQLLDEQGLEHRPLEIRGTTRENFTVWEETSKRRFRFVLPGPSLEEREWRGALDALDEAAGAAKYVVISGSLPKGVPEDFLARAAELCHRRNVPLVVDSSSSALRHALDAGVYLVKPNTTELEQVAGRSLSWPEETGAVASDLIRRGSSEVVVVSHGSEGALVVSAEGVAHVPAVEVEPASTVGAGDSYVGGIVAGLLRGWPLHRAARLGAAAAGATLMTPGTRLCRREDAERLLRENFPETSENAQG